MISNIYDLQINEFENVLVENKIPKFKAKQIWNWLYINLVSSFEEMRNIDKKTIDVLKANVYFPQIENIDSQSDNEKTEKVLLRLKDNNSIETVLMKQRYGYSVCVTSQIGCAIGCQFCASGINGFKRNLTTGEIVMQVVYWQRKLKKIDKRVSQVVIMGIGEPFNNYNNVIKFIDIINDEKSLNIGARHITVSTSGVVNKINQLSDYPKQVNLAISLHASNNQTRSSIMKINDVYPIEKLMDSVIDYQNKTNRRVSFEYILLKGVNDSDADALELVNLIKNINCHVNLIPYNYVQEFDFIASDKMDKFHQILLNNKINVTVRNSKGTKIAGACGQLRHKEEMR